MLRRVIDKLYDWLLRLERRMGFSYSEKRLRDYDQGRGNMTSYYDHYKDTGHP